MPYLLTNNNLWFCFFLLHANIKERCWEIFTNGRIVNKHLKWVVGTLLGSKCGVRHRVYRDNVANTVAVLGVCSLYSLQCLYSVQCARITVDVDAFAVWIVSVTAAFHSIYHTKIYYKHTYSRGTEVHIYIYIYVCCGCDNFSKRASEHSRGLKKRNPTEAPTNFLFQIENGKEIFMYIWMIYETKCNKHD